MIVTYLTNVDAVVDGVDNLDVNGAVGGDVLTNVNLTYPR